MLKLCLIDFSSYQTRNVYLVRFSLQFTMIRIEKMKEIFNSREINLQINKTFNKIKKTMNIFEFCEVRFRNKIAIINLVYFIEIYISLLFYMYIQPCNLCSFRWKYVDEKR